MAWSLVLRGEGGVQSFRHRGTANKTKYNIYKKTAFIMLQK